MRPIYIGDARHIGKRLRQHQSGNVEASALRKHIAATMGYGIVSERRASGSYRKRLDLDDPKAGEQEISRYIRTGGWRFVRCADYEEAHDVQWYLIDVLEPVLNVERRDWEQGRRGRYEALRDELLA